jgi:acyl-CoA dehydrogenase
MSEHDDLRELANSIFSDAWGSSTAAGFDQELWSSCEQAGIARLTLPEVAGGSGGSLTAAAVVLAAAGTYAARIPLVETDLLAGWLLQAAGIEVPPGPLTAVVCADLRVEPVANGGAAVSGALRKVPWASTAAGIVVLTGDRVLSLDPAATTIIHGVNLAEEPRDDVILENVTLDVSATATAPARAATEFSLRAALGRSLLLAGAANGALAMAVRYAGERVQFGRPIGRLQAIQQQLALAAAEVAAAAAASGAAARKAEGAGFDDPATAFAVAVAKARCGEAAGQVARIAHQVHGAMGFTREHDLRLVTTRLWAWRDEDGSDAYWNERVGTRVLDVGADGLWPLITA